MIHARITFWMPLVGLLLPLVEARGGEPAMPPPIPVGTAAGSAPTWQQVLDDQVAPAQVPAPTPPVAPRPAVVPPGTQQPGTVRPGTPVSPGTVRPGTTVPPTPSPTTPGTPLTTADPLATPPSNLADANSAYLAINSQPATSTVFGTGGAGGATAPRLGVLQMIGDQSPFQTLHASATVPAVPSPPSPFPPKTPPSPPEPAPGVGAGSFGPRPQDRRESVAPAPGPCLLLVQLLLEPECLDRQAIRHADQ